MLGVKLRDFARQHGAQKTRDFFGDCLKEGKIKSHNISLRNLAEGICGYDWQDKLKTPVHVLESGDAVDSSAFSNITGQLLVNEIKEKYEAQAFIARDLVDTVPITNGNLGEQKVPFLSDVVDEPRKLQQGERYPHTEFQEQWIEYPAPEKYGQICNVTMEAIFSDLTQQIIESARNVGERVAIWQEEKILDTVLGLSNTHKWNGTTYSTYLDSGNWINKKASTPLTDWNSINVAEQLFSEILNPVTSKPINVQPDALLVMPFKFYTAKRVTSATETRHTDNSHETLAPNPLDTTYPVYKSQYAYRQIINSGVTATNARDWWFLGQFKKAFCWREVYPLKTEEAPAWNPLKFEADIAMQVRAGIFGVPGVKDPRYVAWMYNN